MKSRFEALGAFIKHYISSHLYYTSLTTTAVLPTLKTKSVAPEPSGSSPYSQQPATGLYPEPNGSTLHPQTVSLTSILIPSYHLYLGLPSCLHLVFPTKTLYTFLSSAMLSTCPARLNVLDLICLIMFGEEYIIRSSSLCNYLQSPVNSSLFGPNILIKTLFSNTLSLCSSPNVRDQVSHPYKTTGRIMVSLPNLYTWR
jgi:hypothetical protein